MDSFMETQYHDQNQHQQSNTATNLLRFRSAPSSLLTDYITPTTTNNSNNNIISYDSKPQKLNLNNSHNGYSGSSSSSNSSRLLPPQYPKNLIKCNSNSIQRSSSLVVDKMGSDDSSCGDGLNLNRRCSSHAGSVNQLDAQNGYTVMRGRRSVRVGGSTNGEASSQTSRLSLSHLPQIPEIGNENIKDTSPLGLKYRNREDDSGFDSVNGFSFTTWNGSGSETSHLSENGGVTIRSNVLSHHLSLPKTSAEMTVVEKLMHFQDMVPCKVRAKRGFATHPRSIAERVRRNRISERMRKLQDLVPNMDKQTNTTDMLDLAVEYIKELQQQHKVLSNNRAKCSCGNDQPRLKF